MIQIPRWLLLEELGSDHRCQTDDVKTEDGASLVGFINITDTDCEFLLAELFPIFSFIEASSAFVYSISSVTRTFLESSFELLYKRRSLAIYMNTRATCKEQLLTCQLLTPV